MSRAKKRATPVDRLIMLMQNVTGATEKPFYSAGTVSHFHDLISEAAQQRPEYQQVIAECNKSRGAIPPFPYHLILEADERPKNPREFDSAVESLLKASYCGAALVAISKVEDKRRSLCPDPFAPKASFDDLTGIDMRNLCSALTYAFDQPNHELGNLVALRAKIIKERKEALASAAPAIEVLSRLNPTTNAPKSKRAPA